MDLTNKQVLHKSFGKGKIVDFNDSYMLINFKSGNRKFVYPDAFDGYLKLVEKEAANSVDKILQIQEKERKIEEEKIEKEKVEEFEEQQRLERIDKLIKSHKMHSSSQVAFNCDKDELNDIFTDWKTFTGTIKSGDNKGKTNKLIRVHQNSACLITSKDSGAKEKDRCILGLYMVDEKFMGRLCEDGYIPSFCTACYREGRTGDRFMHLAKSGEIKNICQPNALMTFKEYLVGYGSENLKKLGQIVIDKELEKIPDEKTRELTRERLQQIEEGEQDLYF